MNLERALAAVGRDLDVPETPDLVPAVLAQIGSRSTPASPARRRWALAIALIVVAALAATLAIPDARSALFRFLSIGGERIEVVDSLPEVPVQEDLALTLGEEVTLEEARGTPARSRFASSTSPRTACSGASGGRSGSCTDRRSGRGSSSRSRPSVCRRTRRSC